MTEKVQKIIANRGFSSRREAEKLIKEGKVLINGKLATIGDRASEKDKIIIDGKPLYREEKVYFALNKPRSVVSTCSDEHGRKTLLDYVNTDKRIYPVGRLDYDTTGIILLTNDGELANMLMHPKQKIEKTYLVKINKVLDMEEFHKIKGGINIEGRKVEVKKLKIRKIDKKKNISFVELTICEGRNHIVKKLFRKLKIDVLKLKRISFAGIYLGKLGSGEARKLKKSEINYLKNLGAKWKQR